MFEVPIKNRIIGIINFFKVYFTNPIQGMKQCPDWQWPTLFSIQLFVSIFLGIISDIVTPKALTLVPKVIIFPFSTFLTCFFGACFFYFLFLFLYNRQLSFHRIYTLLFLALIPFLILRILSSLIAPINLIGFAITLIFLTVGFVESFLLPKKSIIKLFSALFAAYFVVWSAQQIYFSRREMNFRKTVPSKSLEENEGIEDVDKIEKEINENF